MGLPQKFFFSLLIFFIIVNPIYLYSQDKRVANAKRIQGEPPRIDGIIEEEVWLEGEWNGDFTQQQPFDGKKPSQSTDFKILYDDNNIYIAIRAWDTSPDSIVNLLSRRDSGDGDGVGIEFDSYYDHQTAFSFIVLASGVKLDKLITLDGDNEDVNWDAIWDAKTSIDDKGYHVELKIPFNQLRFSNQQEQVWGLQVGRFLYRKEELSLWQPVPRDAPGWVHQFGVLKGIEKIKPKKQIEIAPYFVAKTERFEPEEGNPFATGKRNHLSGGVDAKVGLTNDIILDMTILPDFGQVEADPSEVNLTAFETYYPEKRPFFIEGSNLFDYRLAFENSDENLFYSRRIGRIPQGSPDLKEGEYARVPESTQIYGAAKVSGKVKSGLSFAIMEVLTAREFAQVDINGKKHLEEVEPLTNYFVGSLHKDYNKSNTRISGMFTASNRFTDNENLNFLHSAAYSGGVNFFHQWNNKKYYLNFKSYFSHVEGSNEAITRTQRSSARYFQRPDATHVSVDSLATSLTGHGGNFIIGKGGEGHWRYAGFVSWKSPKLEVNDIGYIRSVDNIFQMLWIEYQLWEPFSIFRELSISFNQWTGYNYTGELSYFGGEINFDTQFKNYWHFGCGLNPQGKSISYTALRGGPSLMIPSALNGWLWTHSDNRKKIVAGFSNSFTQGESQRSQSFSLNLSYKPSNALVISIAPIYEYSQEQLQFVDNIIWNGNTSYINASINQELYFLQLRINYSVTPDLSIQLYGRPFIAKGKYYDFKRISKPRAEKFSDQFHIFSPTEIIYHSTEEYYSVDETGNGEIDYSFENPNFNYRSYQSNLVIRWEYRPGSTIFLVWSQGRDSYEIDYSKTLKHNANELWNTYPHNVFLVKLAYRFY